MRNRPLILAALALALAAPAEPARALDDVARAHSLLADAQRRLARGSHEQRQFARNELEDAARLAPTDDGIALALGHVQLEADVLGQARLTAEGVVARDSSSIDGHELLGLVWRRQWLVDVDETARDHAIVEFARVLRLAPRQAARWRPLVPLLVDAGELAQAHELAMMALHGAPSDPQAQVLAGTTAQLTGDLALAAKLFDAGVPRLPAAWRERYDDLLPLIPEWRDHAWHDMTRAERARETAAYWRSADPDPVTPENEAKLEFDARVTQAWLLWGMADPDDWDMRAQLYIRYGAPEITERGSMTNVDASMNGTFVVWTYPDLGMRVWMEAPNPLGHYRGPFSFSRTAIPMPFPDSLAKHPELEAQPYGWALFRKLPANVQPLDVQCTLAHFEGNGGPRLLAQAETRGEPADQFTATWVVLDTSFTEVARGSADMAPSACRPDQARAASFTPALAPGQYRIGLRVSDGANRLGSVRRDLVVPGPSAALALSDLVITCESPQLAVVPGEGVRLEPETGLYPAVGDALNAYLEIYHLATDAGGDATFEYVCTVRALQHDSRAWVSRLLAPKPVTTPVEVSRRETTHGDMRRQFLSVPLRGLPAGDYELVVRVRDVASGAEQQVRAHFARTS